VTAPSVPQNSASSSLSSAGLIVAAILAMLFLVAYLAWMRQSR